ncbi:ATP-binding SpoIIE family protein phosphatase [Streptomyces olivochromogenes]|uniref:ATP-binding SpoIIE family protein phosphatase n=1 Tax=Streptomyces olivochromogenes TaxID=1963 RepID=UPI001F1698E8|nr:SpoIIE family protein phosphatase [Streptomyces olivochromogenes]MCF3131170.1 SpoIIE family protein phosphatase [Streptomyces olivochromogenes]
MHESGSSASTAGRDTAAVVIDRRGVVIFSTPAAAADLRCSPGQVCPALAELVRHGSGVREAVLSGQTPGAAHERRCVVLPLLDAAEAHGDSEHWLIVLSPRTPARGPRRDYAELAHEAATSLGDSLDVTEIGQSLVNLLVPGFADLATVDLSEVVLVGDEPPPLHAGSDVRLLRVAAAQSPGVSAEYLLPTGETVPPVPESTIMSPLTRGRALIASDMAALRAGLGVDAATLRALVPEDAHASVAVPLYARGHVLGCLTVWRGQISEPFGEDDAALLEDIASHAALRVDNARRYLREHRSAVILQRSLLPQASLSLPAGDTCGVYQPATGDVGVGGDWFDVVQLPSLRLGLVVGDVVGHGLHATAAMARLRTAVQALADLDLQPDELLAHLDDLVLGLTAEAETGHTGSALLGATCLYAVYDPVAGTCSFSSAGHLSPAVTQPDSGPAFPDIKPGPPLGVGGAAFVVTDLDVPAGSLLALFTDGLVKTGTSGIDGGMRRLLECLSHVGRRSLEDASLDLFAELVAPTPPDDVALLLARTRRIPARDIADCRLPADLSQVATAREFVERQLAQWGLDDLAFATELIVSELVTNAIRYAGGPVGVRLVRDRVLVIEVSDPGVTRPRVRRARDTDEGGRGLFLVSELADRWGSRFTGSGKTIWAEQTVQPVRV